MNMRATRRRFLTGGTSAVAGLALGASPARGQGHDHGAAAESGQLAPDHPMFYGRRSRFAEITRTPTNMGVSALYRDPNGLSALTPLSKLRGTIITPAGLHYVSSHGHAPPDIDPKEHRLLIYGKV